VFVTFNIVFSLNNVIIIQLCSVASALQFKTRSISQIIIYILFVVAHQTVRRIIFWRDLYRYINLCTTANIYCSYFRHKRGSPFILFFQTTCVLKRHKYWRARSDVACQTWGTNALRNSLTLSSRWHSSVIFIVSKNKKYF